MPAYTEGKNTKITKHEENTRNTIVDNTAPRPEIQPSGAPHLRMQQDGQSCGTQGNGRGGQGWMRTLQARHNAAACDAADCRLQTADGTANAPSTIWFDKKATSNRDNYSSVGGC